MDEDIPLVVWVLCFGKVGEVISYLFGPVRGHRQTGPQCLTTPPVSASSIYAATVYVSGGLGQSVNSGVFLLSCLSNSLSLFFLLSEDLSPRTMPQHYLA